MFKIGSCRMDLDNYYDNTFYKNIAYTHTSKEVIQWLDILENKLNIKDISFSELVLQNNKIYDLSNSKINFNKSEIILIEISSMKIKTYNNFFYNINYFSNKSKDNQFIKEFINGYIQTEEELYNDLLIIQKRLPNKKIIFVGHLLMNFYDYPNFNTSYRSKIDSILRKIKKNTIVLSDLFKTQDYKEVFDNDINHYKVNTKKVIANKLASML